MRYVLNISYQGTHYAGWQVQSNAHTVQAEIDAALSTLLRTDTSSVGAGRTDSGVHARQLIVHFDSDAELPDGFLHGMNGILPWDIAVNAVYQPRNPDFHARFDAISRAYEYRIVRKKSPFDHPFAMWVRHELNIEVMNCAAALLLEYEDFASFCKAHGDNQTTLCRMDHAFWEEQEGILLFQVKANRFLRGMVRALVGTLLLVGRGKLTVKAFRKLIKTRDRKQAGPSADAKGLFLKAVEYEKGALLPLPNTNLQQ